MSHVLADVLQAELIDQFLHFFASLVPRDGLGFQNREDVLFYGQLPKYRSFLRQVADAILTRSQVHGDISDVFGIDENAARIWRDQTDDAVKGCGLAGAVRSK